MARPKLNHTAACDSLKALSGRLGAGHEALVVMVRSLARAVDEQPHNASLWREYRASVETLLEVTAGDDDADSADARGFLAAVQTPMGDIA